LIQSGRIGSQILAASLEFTFARRSVSLNNVHSPLPAVSGRAQDRIMDELTDSERGRFVVRTESSRYMLELTDDGYRLCRVPGDGVGPVEHPPPPGPVSTLRRDGNELVLLHIGQCRLGNPAQFVLGMPDGEQGVPDGYLATLRITTIVRQIERVD
jgi:hypothetical protein